MKYIKDLKKTNEKRLISKKEILEIKESKNKVPSLTVILIGNYTPSQIYVKNKEKNSKEVGMNSDVIKYSVEVTEKEILDKIKELNNDQNVSGILVQLPLPKQIDKEKINNAKKTSIYKNFLNTFSDAELIEVEKKD